MVRVTLTRQAALELDRLPLTIQARMRDLFERLERWPEVSGVRPLRSGFSGYYRVRTGDYRVLFRVTSEALIVAKIGHSDRFYED